MSDNQKDETMRPLTLENGPILWPLGNVAYADGVLTEFFDWCGRYGHFQSFFAHHGVVVKEKLALDSVQAVQLQESMIDEVGYFHDPVVYGGRTMCPPTAERIKTLDVHLASLQVPSKFVPNKGGIPKGFNEAFMAGPTADVYIAKEDAKPLLCVEFLIENHPKKAL